MLIDVVDMARTSAFAAILLAAGCASGMTTADCASADWTAIGLEDGRTGARPKLFDQRRKACEDAGASVDLAAYSAAREQGLKIYCTTQGGFNAGRDGAEYSGLCRGDDEMQFLESFALGAKLRVLTEAREAAVQDYEAAIADLDQHNYLLRVSEKRYAKPSISNEDREHERQDADFRRREIDRIENRLPHMLDEIENARAALESYRIELLSMGLEI
ncbi:MAG: hypothetical protein A3E78_15355 [Alphaproteobacteria bacterium RIFCSPHIGHO2_12_FULL_63_12]|nr:MAG: hypothetical protein A3E78_15355 [Alphaproteobacteria bacterium RIFCSPHIGHO2_12_FULL_63_12]